MPTEEYTKESLEALLTSSKDSTAVWKNILDPKTGSTGAGGSIGADGSTSNTSITPVEASHVDEPLGELVKLSQLIHAHSTKLGIVFKPVVASENYRAAYKELESTLKVVALLVSVSLQLDKESAKYSKMFTTELLTDSRSLLLNFGSLSGELFKSLELTSSEDTTLRLPTIGKVWAACKHLEDTATRGSTGILKRRLKQSNSLIADALEEFNEWIEDPTSDAGDLVEVDLEDFDSPRAETPGLDADVDEDVDKDLIKFAQVWGKKVALVKLLMSSLDKSIPSAKYNTKFSKSIDLLDIKRQKLSELIDDLVADVIYEQDKESSEKDSKLLEEEALEVAEIVRRMNQGNETRQRWLDTWITRFKDNI